MVEKNLGTVEWFDNKRGYGFIKMDDDPENLEYFVHFSNIICDGSYKTLKDDERVSFTLEQTDKGVQAINVEVIDE